MNIIDNVINFFSPLSGLKRLQARAIMSIYGNTHTGAMKMRQSMRGWSMKSSTNPDDEVLPDIETLRVRTRDLYKNNPIAGGAIKTTLTNVIGSGLRLQSRIDREFLGMDDDEADDWEADVERQFRMWAEYPDADAGRRMNFYELQQLAFLSVLHSGEVMALLPLVPRPGTVSDLRIYLIEADRVSNPYGAADNPWIAGGIEIGQFNEPIAYHMLTTPGGFLNPIRKWVRIPAFGEKSGRQNVIHLFTPERPGQRRGTPYLTPVIETLKQLGRYTESELMAAVVSSMFTVFVKSSTGSGDIIASALPADQKIDQTGGSYELGSGAIIGLAPDESIETANPGRPNQAFDAFVQSLLRQVGMALEIPYELLIRHFQASYSASRAALLEAWKFFKVRRQWMSTKFCQPVYEEWLTEAVLNGRVKAPGFLDNTAIRRAYSMAEFIGPAPGQIDPVKETQAAQERVDLTISTLSEETAQIVGGDWSRKVRQRAKEQRIMEKLGLNLPGQTNQASGNPPDDAGTDETTDKKKEVKSNAETE
jgi:lambda family phage portal protein